MAPDRGPIAGSSLERSATETPSFLDYIGADLAANIDRVFIEPLPAVGYHCQPLPNNWKPYAKNNRDSSTQACSMCSTTPSVVRPNIGGGVKISDSGWHHLRFTQREPLSDNEAG